MNKKSYYDVLGLSENASEDDIKNSYRKLTIKWHPDKWSAKSEAERNLAEEKMKEINEAYGILSDLKKRKNYDRYGNDDSFTQNSNSARGFGGEDDFFKDIFSTFFGRDSRSTRQESYSENSNKRKTGKDVLIELNLTFKDSILGTKKKVSLRLEKSCTVCNQTGAASPMDIYDCSNCQGQGTVNAIQRTILGPIRTQVTCSRCQGNGKIIKKKCGNCGGDKLLLQKEILELTIPRGIQPEKRLRYQGIGNDGWYGGGKGDLYVDIKIKENPYFQRKGNDIHVNLPISFLDAILGNSVEVISLEGIKKISIPAGTQNGDHLILRNYGCYLGVNKNSRGDFYIWMQIKLPKKITIPTEKILSQLQHETNWNPNHEFIEKNKDVIEK